LNWIDRLQQRFQYLAIQGLGRYIVGLQALCFALGLADARFVDALRLDPALVAQGEVWRLVTFLFLPSLTPFNILFAVFYFMFQWTVFEALESEWGAFKLTLYCFIGWLCAVALPLGAWMAWGQELLASGGYWSVSIELAFAFLYPEFTVTIYFILPLKMKWMAWIIGVFLLVRIFLSSFVEALPIAFGLLNYLLFFGPEYIARARLARQVRQGRQVFTAAKRDADQVLRPRACCQCGAGPDAELRLCSCPRCGEDGRLWCARHLPDHLAELELEAEAAAAAAAAQAAGGAGRRIRAKKKAPAQRRDRG
jgi:hypothetical protein